jgi:hypothetical protein
MALVAQVAGENDPKRFHALLFELDQVLSEKVLPIRGDGKTSPPPRRTGPKKWEILSKNP